MGPIFFSEHQKEGPTFWKAWNECPEFRKPRKSTSIEGPRHEPHFSRGSGGGPQSFSGPTVIAPVFKGHGTRASSRPGLESVISKGPTAGHFALCFPLSKAARSRRWDPTVPGWAGTCHAPLNLLPCAPISDWISSLFGKFWKIRDF